MIGGNLISEQSICVGNDANEVGRDLWIRRFADLEVRNLVSRGWMPGSLAKTIHPSNLETKTSA